VLVLDLIFDILECFSGGEGPDEWSPLRGKAKPAKRRKRGEPMDDDVPLWRENRDEKLR